MIENIVFLVTGIIIGYCLFYSIWYLPLFIKYRELQKAIDSIIDPSEEDMERHRKAYKEWKSNLKNDTKANVNLHPLS